jgi:SAM-dependent methyltransferase
MTTATQADELEKKAGRTFWDANPCGGQWQDYAAFLGWYRRTEPYMFDTVDAFDWDGLKVLEIGCGQGALVNHLSGRGASMVGVDMSPASLRRAAAGAHELGLEQHVRLLQADAERLPFPDATFDRVVSFGVLHHTPDTSHAVAELRRVLRPEGRAIVMLYRTGNPKWLATRVLRSFARFLDRRSGTLVDRSRADLQVNDSRGTALLELFGVPTLKAYSNRESRAMFAAFEDLNIRNCQPGFQRLADIKPILRPLRGALAIVDRVMQRPWGFYQVIHARKRRE